MILEINEQVVDLPENTKGLIRLNKSVAALSDLETRSGEFSWQFTLPPTRKNAGIFGQVLHAQTLDKYQRQTYPFRLRAGGQEWRGVFRLVGLKNGYSGSLTTETLGWATSLGEKTLPELKTLPPVSYNGSQLEAILAKSCDETDIQFPMVAYGNFFAPPFVDMQGEEQPTPAGAFISYPLATDDLPASVYYISVLRAILREAGTGYYAGGSILSDLEFRRWCITAAGSKGDFWPWGALLPATNTATTLEQQYSYYQNSPDNFTNTAAGFDVANEVMYFMPKTPNVAVAGGTRAMTDGKPEYTAPVSGTYTFSWGYAVSGATQVIDEQNNNGSPNYWAGFAPVVVGLVVFRGGEGYEGADGGVCTNGTGRFDLNQTRVLAFSRIDQAGNFTNLQARSFNGVPLPVYLEAGDVVRLLFFTRRIFSRTGDGVNRYIRREFRLSTVSASLACTAFDGPLLLEPAKVLPTITQKAFLRDFFVRANIVPFFSGDTQTVHFLSREAYSIAQGLPITLDDCIDPATLEYVPVLAGSGSVVFKPAEVEDVPAGSDVVSVRLSGAPLTDQAKVVESSFGFVNHRWFRVDRFGDILLASVATAEEEATNRTESSQVVTGKAPRVVVFSPPVSGGTKVPFQNREVIPGQGRYAGTGYAWDGDSGAVSRHYRGFLSQAARGHLCKVQADLTPAKYVELSPGRRVYIMQAEYSIESIEGFSPDGPSSTATITLLRRV